jgi:hypothetical protein
MHEGSERLDVAVCESFVSLPNGPGGRKNYDACGWWATAELTKVSARSEKRRPGRCYRAADVAWRGS